MAAEKPVRGKVISKAHLGCDLAGVLAHAGTLLAALSAIFRWAARSRLSGIIPFEGDGRVAWRAIPRGRPRLA